MKKIITLIFITLFFLGCSSSKKVEVQTPTYPSWYLNPLFEDSIYLYGIGEGNNLDKALKSALISISSRLSLTISSSSSIKNKSYIDYREYVTKESVQDIFSKTEDLTFNNYLIESNKKMGFNSFIVYVKVKKSDLVNSLLSELKNLENITKEKEKVLLKKDSLSKYFTYKTIFNEYNSKIKKVQILKNLKKEFDDKKYYDKLKYLYSKIIKNKSESTFFLSNKTNNQTPLNKLKESLNNENFLVLEKNKAQYKIEISSNINRKNPRGFYIVNNNISFEIYLNNSLIKTKNYMIKGVSSNSYEDAISNSYEELELSYFTQEIFSLF